MSQSYDAILFVSFGGPEGMTDVMPFLQNVLRGKNVPPERMHNVARHYELFGGVSPINEQNRQIIAALTALLAAEGPNLPVYWGNRNWHPMLAETIKRMADDGIKHALAFVTSAYSSFSGCRQYLGNIEEARAVVGPSAPVIDKIRAYFDHPGFIGPNVENVTAALGQIPASRRDLAYLGFTAHSMPIAMADGCDYVAQLEEVGGLIAKSVFHANWTIVYQSRSGPPDQPWLGPDVCDYIRAIAKLGARDVVLAPVGFISDHLEVKYDLDTEARLLAESLDINFIRAATPGTQPKFVRMIRELILERTVDKPRRYLGRYEPRPDVCWPDCCSYDIPARPAAAD
ncbi:MAG: ferrochelatase [Pyrinomonadaceae bacterium]